MDDGACAWIGEQLFHAEEAHAVIDLDELARMRPALADEPAWGNLTVKNLRAVWPNYRALGIRRVVLAGVVRSATTVEAYRSAIPGAELTIVRVRAAHDTLHARLRHREPGTKRTFLLDVASQLDDHIAGLGVEDFAVDNRPGDDIADLARIDPRTARLAHTRRPPPHLRPTPTLIPRRRSHGPAQSPTIVRGPGMEPVGPVGSRHRPTTSGGAPSKPADPGLPRETNGRRNHRAPRPSNRPSGCGGRSRRGNRGVD